jgi:hypothetical protein
LTGAQTSDGADATLVYLEWEGHLDGIILDNAGIIALSGQYLIAKFVISLLLIQNL